MGSFNKWIRGEKSLSTQEQADYALNKSISSSLSLNLKHLSKLFSGIPELITRTFPLKNGQEAALIYMEGLVDKTVINVNILRPLLFKEWNEDDFGKPLFLSEILKKFNSGQTLNNLFYTAKVFYL